MHKLITTTLAAVLAFAAQAQLQIGLLADYHHSFIYNKDDVAADDRLNNINTYKIHINLGNKGFGFYGRINDNYLIY